MTNTEIELIAAIYILYLHECVHWIKDDCVAYTRQFMGGWKRWEISPLSFTLLHRMPCFVSLVPVSWGFVAFCRESKLDDTHRKSLEESDGAVDRQNLLLRCSAAMEGLILLVLIPAAIIYGQLEHLYLPISVAFFAAHISTATLFAVNLGRWEPNRTLRRPELIQIFVNPVAAVRSPDRLMGKMLARKKSDEIYR